MTDNEIRDQIDEWTDQFYESLDDIEDSEKWKESLDESISSLSALDDLVYELWGEEGPSDKNFNMLVAVFGSYVAKAIQNEYEGSWEINSENVWLYNIEIGENIIGIAVFAWMHKRFKNEGNLTDRVERLESTIENAMSESEIPSPNDQNVKNLRGWTNQQKILSWLEDEAGLLIGAFGCSISENAEEFSTSFTIELDETPSTYSNGERAISVSPTDRNHSAIISVATEDEGRQMTINIYVEESGRLDICAFPHILVPVTQLENAQRFADLFMANSKSINLQLVKQGESNFFFKMSMGPLKMDDEAPLDLNEVLDKLLTQTYTNWSNLQAFGH